MSQTTPTTMTPPRQRTVGAVDAAGRGLTLQEPMPELTRGHVLVHTRASMISPGTQLGGARQARQEGATPDQGEPRPIGYQASGDVIAVGDDVQQFAPGDRVACLGSGAKHSDWIVVPQNLCVRLPDGVSYEDASACNLVLTAMHAVRRAEPVLGEYMLVVGMGLVGQLAARMAHLAGMYAMGWDTVAGRLAIARRMGIDAAVNVKTDDVPAACQTLTRGMGFDAAIMAIGGDGTAALEQVKQAMKVSPDGHEMGRVIMVGGMVTQSRWGAGMGNLDVRSAARTGPGYHDPAWEVGDVTYPPVFMRWTTQTNLQLILRWLDEKRLDMQPLITHRLPLAQMDQAVDLLLEQPDQALGVVLTTDDTPASET